MLMFVGVAFGIILGAIPGFTGSLGIALLLPVTFSMDPLPSLVLLLSVYTGGLFGGSITAILLNTPGSPAAVATTFDGYEMTKRGESERALGLSVVSSTLGGMIGIIILFIIIQPLAKFTLKFGPPEMFMIAVFGLTIIASLKGKSFSKTLYAGLFGVLLGTIGMSSSGAIRGTFGSYYLLDGIPIIPALIGLFAVSEIFILIDQKYVSLNAPAKSDYRKLLRGIKEGIKYPFTLLRSSVIGVFIGALPAAGATIASLVSYNEAQRQSKNKKNFGKGEPEGVVAAESANNASEGGALATMLVLGIPGGAATAMLLGAIIMQGWVPGPRLFIDHKDVIYGVIVAEFIQMFILLLVGIVIAILASRLVQVPTRVLIPTIAVLCIMGAFAYRNMIFDAALVFIFGIIGYFLRKFDYPTIAVVLGLILGPIADAELLRTAQRFAGDYTVFFTRPISLTILIITIVGSFSPYIIDRIKKKNRKNGEMRI